MRVCVFARARVCDASTSLGAHPSIPPPRLACHHPFTSSPFTLLTLPRPQILSLSLLRSVGGIPHTQGDPGLRTYVAPETAVLYLVGLAQFIILALVFNKGAPHRWGLCWGVFLLDGPGGEGCAPGAVHHPGAGVAGVLSCCLQARGGVRHLVGGLA